MVQKVICILVLIIGFSSCDSSQENMDNNSNANVNEKYFFDFDELIHYRIEINENDLIDIADKDNISQKERLQIDIILWNKPDSIIDTSFIEKLEGIGFKKRKISEEKFNGINEIFKEKEVEDGVAYSCIAVFRDILIFRKKGKVVGIAKICFSCDQKRILGTTANTINFGQDGDYHELSKILNE